MGPLTSVYIFTFILEILNEWAIFVFPISFANLNKLKNDFIFIKKKMESLQTLIFYLLKFLNFDY